ncbi:MAG: cellulase family glycosylhydrolase [Ignavibacteria bacterium]|jgi:aryl-phospho-beta-D-glucosidase BglC (GH1 family)
MKIKAFILKSFELFSNRQSLTFLLLGLFFSTPLFSQLPSASEIAGEMTIGWNIGNSLEVPTGETDWGNPKVDQELINAVSDAGFNTIRIPCAWDSYADQSNLEIDANWLERVKEVVDYCYANDMYIILNCHWDGGWLENNVTESAQDSVNEKQEAYWTQIAEYFKDYDEHLLFAGTNEPNVDNATQMSVLLTYLQTFIDAVRVTGGNNSSRVLVFQGPSTDIDKTDQLMTTLPTDQIENRLMAEIHYYTPWNFCGLEDDASWGNMFYFWGQDYHSTTNTNRNATWGEEDAVESYFQKMKTKFVDNGIPVILGEYGAIKRLSLTGDDLELHIASREYYYNYVTNAAVRYGMIPIYWDNGWDGDNGFALFDRDNGDIVDQGALDALIEGVNEATPIEQIEDEDNSSPVGCLNVFPNPAYASTEIRLFLNDAEHDDVSVYNILGQEVVRFNNLNLMRGENRINWNTGNLSTGIYFIKVNINNQVLTRKVMVIR